MRPCHAPRARQLRLRRIPDRPASPYVASAEGARRRLASRAPPSPSHPPPPIIPEPISAPYAPSTQKRIKTEINTLLPRRGVGVYASALALVAAPHMATKKIPTPIASVATVRHTAGMSSPPAPITAPGGAHSTHRPPKSFLGVTIPADLAFQVAAHCAAQRVSKSLYTEVALRRALAQDAAAPPATPAPVPATPTPASEVT